MTILEHIKKATAQVREKPLKERLEYFWDYYKWHAIVIVLVIAILTQGIVAMCNRRETAFCGIFLNCKISIDDDTFLQGFYDFAGIDAASQEATFYTDLSLTDGESQNDINTFRRIMAGIANKDTDIIVGQTEAFRLCAYNSAAIFADLRQALDQETLSRLSGRLYYIDGAVLRELDAPVGTQVYVDVTTLPDPTKPEAMEDPIPVGINISDLEDFRSAYYLTDAPLYLGIVANAPRPDTALQFIDYLLP